ncbi:MAG: M23 family metallopeptidase [Thermaurantimonas sp.]
MNLLYRVISGCFLMFSTLKSWGQDEIKLPDYFGPPLDIPLQLSGTFGELRTNHFHGGLDLRTGGTEGKRVLAAADGYIARINVSPYGYGKALYIQHPNGYMTVYAHLQRFNTPIEQYVRQEQYKRESFEVELYPAAGVLSVKKGDLIALSGNTGSSGGPHLHFEIRDQGGERALNPLAFGYDIPDTRHPELAQLLVYSIDEDFFEMNRRSINVRKIGGGVYKLERDSLLVSPLSGFAIETFDFQDNLSFRNGVYSIEKYVDGQLVYKFVADRVRFDQTRYLNAHIDYEYRASTGKNVHRLFLLPGNQLDAYPVLVDKGLIRLTAPGTAHVRIVVRDFANNVSELSFWAVGSEEADSVDLNRGNVFGFNEDITIRDESFVFTAERGTFYRPKKILFTQVPLTEDKISSEVNFGLENVPFHKFATLRLKVNPNHPNASKFVMVNIVNGKRTAIVGSLEDDWYTARVRSFGYFFIQADLVPPKISPINIPAGGNMQKIPVVRFRISDDLSGIKSYRMEIDGKWVLAEFDGKTGLLFHIFENPPSGRSHEIKVRVTDAVGNVSEYKATILR